jgi:hypothetical protein
LPITWREQQRQQEQQEQQRQQERQHQQEREQLQPERREPELPQQEQQLQEPELLLFCHKRSGRKPAGRRAGLNISFVYFLKSVDQHVDC